MPYYVYLLTTKNNGPLYCGVTGDLIRRTWEHKEEFVKGFTSDYHIKKLVWYEVHDDVAAAITREKQIKKWNRAWKIEMINKMNQSWRDLFEELV